MNKKLLIGSLVVLFLPLAQWLLGLFVVPMIDESQRMEIALEEIDDRMRPKMPAKNKTLNKPEANLQKNQPLSSDLLENPVGFLEASEECFGENFQESTSFVQILKNSGFLHGKNTTLRRNRIYQDSGKEIRVSISQASQAENWEASVFAVDSEGYPVLREKKVGESLEFLDQHYQKAFSGAQGVQNEEFLSVKRRGGEGSGTIQLVNNVPVEVKIKLLSESSGRQLECAEGRCGCYAIKTDL